MLAWSNFWPYLASVFSNNYFSLSQRLSLQCSVFRENEKLRRTKNSLRELIVWYILNNVCVMFSNAELILQIQMTVNYPKAIKHSCLIMSYVLENFILMNIYGIFPLLPVYWETTRFEYAASVIILMLNYYKYFSC